MKNKTVIVASMRTGSTLLCRALYQHPELSVKEEILTVLHQQNEANWGDADKYLHEIQKTFDEGVDVFKVLYSHVIPPVWNYFQDNNVKLIHLKRKDQLRQAISIVRADKLNTWSIKHKLEKPRKVEIKQKEIDRWVGNIARAVEKWDKIFSAIDHLELYYTDLVGEEGAEVRYIKQAAADKVLDYIGVKRRRLWIPIYKQGHKDFSEIITNYDKLNL